MTDVSASGSMAAPDLVGQVLDGRYRLIRKLGEGGMGEVYAAEHIHIEKRFAVKMLRPEIVSNKEAVQRFRQEARSSSSIGHRNIIAIEDFGELSDGRIYMCMELLNGAALNDLIVQPMPVDRLLNILIQTGHGLAAAHAKGIVHRDMKPENIFVTITNQGEDIPKILDFGIAKVAGNDGQNHLTRTGTIFGTPFYMAPEQALGNPVDARTDIYAMGVIMYEVFSGSLPFQGDSFMGILTQHITSEPEPVAQRAAKAGRSLPPGLADLVMRCMRKNPAERPQTMDELVNSLIQIYRGVAGPGMSTYMEAFPVAASSGYQVLGAPPTGMLPASGSQPNVLPGGSQPQFHPPTGPIATPGSSGLYDPSASVINVPKKSKAGLIIAIFAVLAVGGGIAAFLIVNGGDTKQATNGSGGSGSNGGAQIGTNPPVVIDAAVTQPPEKVPDAAIATVTPDAAIVEPPHLVDAATIAEPIDAAPSPSTVSVKIFTKNGVAFELWEDGAKVFDGPDDLPVPVGGVRHVVIKSRGFKDKKVDIDTSKLKLQIALEPAATRPPPQTGPDCSKSIVIPSKPCVAQFCHLHPKDDNCQLE
ncbi:MAG TPA: protein kinase [Kofleriaceae bacterium]|jgi:serine/threonine-protein kinase